MNILILIMSMVYGLIPFNRQKKDTPKFIDYALMIIVPICYLACYSLVNFSTFGIYQMKSCDSICRLGNSLFMHLGCFLYLSVCSLSVLRGKNFFIKFENQLNEIDAIIEKCRENTPKKVMGVKSPYLLGLTWGLVVVLFSLAVYIDLNTLMKYTGNKFIISLMVTTFPFVATSVVQGQFIYYVSVIMARFNDLNSLLEIINHECEKQNSPLAVFDIESSNAEKTEKPAKNGDIIIGEEKKKGKDVDEDSEDSDFDEEDLENYDYENKRKDENKGPTSEGKLPELFRLHDKILSLSVLTNSEFGAQCVPYMTVCFVIVIFGIFLETKVIFIVGGKHALLDYVSQIYVLWGLNMMLVAYLVLRLCCNANGKSKNSAMIVHEIMQKKPAFMLGNDLYYNKMKSFTLQFLHWEGFFQFNGIGLFALDYTFIFSTVSAATSYLIVLLQFDMTAILKTEGLM